jgi:enamine deaminase RidA (YjgF/YER057c/UK114 family)
MIGEGKIVAIAGQVGWDPIRQKLVSDDFVQQTRQALANVLATLKAAGGKPEHLIRLTWYITDREAYVSNLKQIGHAYRAAMATHYPTMSVLVVAGLVEPGAKVEIDGTALIPRKTNMRETKAKSKFTKRTSS